MNKKCFCNPSLPSSGGSLFLKVKEMFRFQLNLTFFIPNGLQNTQKNSLELNLAIERFRLDQ